MKIVNPRRENHDNMSSLPKTLTEWGFTVSKLQATQRRREEEDEEKKQRAIQKAIELGLNQFVAEFWQSCVKFLEDESHRKFRFAFPRGELDVSGFSGIRQLAENAIPRQFEIATLDEQLIVTLGNEFGDRAPYYTLMAK
jgi:hypothetical protein